MQERGQFSGKAAGAGKLAYPVGFYSNFIDVWTGLRCCIITLGREGEGQLELW